MSILGDDMKKFLSALAVTSVSLVAATASYAATFTYTLGDFPDLRGRIDFDYGLRLDREGPEGRVFSFEGLQGDDTGATLTYDSTSGTARIEGTVRESLGSGQFGDLFGIEYVMSGLTALTDAVTGEETGGFVDTTGAGQGFVFGAGDAGADLVLGAASQFGGPLNSEFFLHFGLDAVPQRPFAGFEATGWVDSGPGFNDFLFTATPVTPVTVPLPGAAGMLLVSLAGMGLVGRRKTRR